MTRFDVSVKEEGGVEAEAKNGRIFAGESGLIQAEFKFMLSVYDAESGRFLWEGQLNLLKVDDEGVSQVKAILPDPPLPSSGRRQLRRPLTRSFSLRAVNPVTGSLVCRISLLRAAGGEGEQRGCRSVPHPEADQ